MLKIKNDKKWGAVLFASYDYQSNDDYSQLINKITKNLLKHMIPKKK